MRPKRSLQVPRLHDATAGSVELDGVDVATLCPTWLRAQIGVVNQNPVLFTGAHARAPHARMRIVMRCASFGAHRVCA